MNRWKRKVQALMRLAEDQAGKPEGQLARQKLRQILKKYPQAREYEPVRVFMARDIVAMKRMGISTEGSWTGRNLQEAIALMMADYGTRLERAKQPRLEV